MIETTYCCIARVYYTSACFCVHACVRAYMNVRACVCSCVCTHVDMWVYEYASMPSGAHPTVNVGIAKSAVSLAIIYFV